MSNLPTVNICITGKASLLNIKTKKLIKRNTCIDFQVIDCFIRKQFKKNPFQIKGKLILFKIIKF